MYVGTRDHDQQSHSDTFLMILQEPIKSRVDLYQESVSQEWIYTKIHIITSRYLPGSPKKKRAPCATCNTSTTDQNNPSSEMSFSNRYSFLLARPHKKTGHHPLSVNRISIATWQVYSYLQFLITYIQNTKLEPENGMRWMECGILL